eukprot:UN25159
MTTSKETTEDSQFISTLSFAFPFFCAYLIIFLFLRKQKSLLHIYQPNTIYLNRLQPSESIIELCKLLWGLTDDQIESVAGLDALCFLKVTWSCLVVMVVLSPISGILMIIYGTSHNISDFDSDGDKKPLDRLPKLTLGNVENGSGSLWVTVFIVWLFTLLTLYLLRKTFS